MSDREDGYLIGRIHVKHRIGKCKADVSTHGMRHHPVQAGSGANLGDQAIDLIVKSTRKDFAFLAVVRKRLRQIPLRTGFKIPRLHRPIS